MNTLLIVTVAIGLTMALFARGSESWAGVALVAIGLYAMTVL